MIRLALILCVVTACAGDDDSGSTVDAGEPDLTCACGEAPTIDLNAIKVTRANGNVTLSEVDYGHVTDYWGESRNWQLCRQVHDACSD